MVRRLSLLLCAATAGWIWWSPRASIGPRAQRGVWWGLVGASLLVYLNFFHFHGARTFVHLHDAGHYYLGAKYFPELRYDGLYTAMLRAEAELYEDRFKTVEARDLQHDKLVHIRTLLEASGPVKARFTPARWRAFQRDVGYLRKRLGDHLAAFYRDHGFNPTPAWAHLGRALTALAPPADRGGLVWLALLDGIVISAMVAAVGWAFGMRTAALVAIFFCLVFGGGFSWTGGAFLRQGWLAALVIGLCCLARDRPVPAGALIAAATLLRVFPGLFLVGPLLVAVLGRPRHAGPARRLIAAAGLTLAVGGAWSCLPAGGVDEWQAFRGNSQRYVRTVSPNVVGVTPVLAFVGRPGLVTPEAFEAIRDRRVTIHRWQVVLLGLPAAWLLARAYRRRSALEASVACGLVLAFLLFNLAGYYYVFLLAMLLDRDAARRHRAALWLFVGEALAYTLALYEPADAIRYLYRSVLVAYLLAIRFGPQVLDAPRAPATTSPAA